MAFKFDCIDCMLELDAPGGVLLSGTIRGNSGPDPYRFYILFKYPRVPIVPRVTWRSFRLAPSAVPASEPPEPSLLTHRT